MALGLQLYAIAGQPPSIYDLPPGCAFVPRCPYVQERCWHEYPPESAVADGQTCAAGGTYERARR
jgi:oligopeptide/dipeptide ABC transporter ATP-binding protein